MHLLRLLVVICLTLAVTSCGQAHQANAPRPGPTPTPTLASDYPRFPLPAPRPSAKVELTFASLGPGLTSVGAVKRALEQELDRQGYARRSYYAVPGGFAVATQAERFGRDGRPAAADKRWVLSPSALIELGDFSPGRLLAAFRNADPGRYRVLVFLVTTAVRTSANRSIALPEARDWIDNGADAIPAAISGIPLSPDHHFTVLIYEFARPAVASDPNFVAPSHLDARRHLRGAGLLRGRI